MGTAARRRQRHHHSRPRPTALANTANWIPPQVKDPYSVNWNFGVQHSFGKNYTAEVNYVGTRGNHLSFQDIINLATVGHTAERSANLSASALAGHTQRSATGLNTLFSLQGRQPIVRAAECRSELPMLVVRAAPLPRSSPHGWSTYHGLQTSLTRRFSNGLTFQGCLHLEPHHRQQHGRLPHQRHDSSPA